MKSAFSFFLFFISLSLAAQDKSLYKKEWFIQSGDTLPYRIMFPVHYDPAQSYPVVFFLHGRGESGRDNAKQLTHGWKLFASDSTRNRHPAIVIFPQCDTNSYWSNVHTITRDSIKGKRQFYFIEDGQPSKYMTLLSSLIDNVFARFNIDRSRVYVGGMSMGGMGTYELVRRKPKTFAAAFTICAGAHPTTAKQLRKTSWWLFHGMKDDIVAPEFTQAMEAALLKRGADVKATYFPNANHNSWDAAFATPGLVNWVFSKKKE